MHLIPGFKRLALSLAEQASRNQDAIDQEVLYRAAVTKAYYATFHLMRVFAIEHPRFVVISDSANSHDSLIKEFKNNNYTDISAAAFAFKALRKACEYDLKTRPAPALDWKQAQSKMFQIHSHELFKPFLRKHNLKL